mmetsp:Transcript_113973/g.333083  ORF Transcript_113973/g.333083 Transcript_113973/m.333083 type:complete len:381 (-) Transcript_113973:601-1743(-)
MTRQRNGNLVLLLVGTCRPACKQPRLKKRRPLHCRACWCADAGQGRWHAQNRGGLDIACAHLAAGHLLQVRQKSHDLVCDLLADGRVRLSTHFDWPCCKPKVMQAALHSLLPHTHGRAMLSTAGTHFGGLRGAWLGRTVTWVAEVVWHTGCADERGVGRALVGDLNGVAQDQVEPGHDHGDEAGLHVEPRRRLALAAQGPVHVLALRRARGHDIRHQPRVRARAAARARCACTAAASAARIPELARDIRLPGLEALRRCHEPDGVLEGARQAPGSRPPGGPRRLRRLRWLREVGGAEPQELQRVDDVDDVCNVDQDKGKCHGGRRVPAHILQDGRNQGKPRREGSDALDGDLALFGDDVERQDDLLEDEHGQDHADCPED